MEKIGTKTASFEAIISVLPVLNHIFSYWSWILDGLSFARLGTSNNQDTEPVFGIRMDPYWFWLAES
jgi:hypothetical protein